MDNLDLPGMELETDSISTVERSGVDRVLPGGLHPDDVLAFVEEVTLPAGKAAGEEVLPLRSRVSSLTQALENQRSAMERSNIRASRNVSPLLQDKLSKQIQQMDLNHQLALKLISKLQQSIESVTKLQ